MRSGGAQHNFGQSRRARGAEPGTWCRATGLTGRRAAERIVCGFDRRRLRMGNWRLGVFIDAAASDEQAEKLTGVFSGALGGPMGALAPLVGENLGVERAPIEVHEEGLRHSVRIGDVVDFEVEDVVPFGVETGEPARLMGIFHPAGSELTVAHATRSRIDAFGIQYDGNSGFSTSRFLWAA
jgi:hypothetical protein